MRRLGDPWFNRIGLRGPVPWGNAPGGYGGESFSPLTISGLKIWLDSSTITGLVDGAAVSAWNDLSGNNNNFAQANAIKQPTFQSGVGDLQNNLPVVRFDGANDILVHTPSGLGNDSSGTVIYVAKLLVALTQYKHVVSFGWSVGVNFMAMTIRYANAFPSLGVEHKVGGTVNGVVGTTVADTTFRIHEINSNGSAWSVYLNGNLEVPIIHTGANNGRWLDDINDDNVALGGTQYNSTETNFANCDIGEVFYFNRQINSTERAALVAYLKAKWGTP